MVQNDVEALAQERDHAGVHDARAREAEVDDVAVRSEAPRDLVGEDLAGPTRTAALGDGGAVPGDGADGVGIIRRRCSPGVMDGLRNMNWS